MSSLSRPSFRRNPLSIAVQAALAAAALSMPLLAHGAGAYINQYGTGLNANNNTVSTDSSTVYTQVIGGHAVGGSGGSASYNTVNITSGTVINGPSFPTDAAVAGGMVENGDAAQYNTVNIYGGSSTSITGDIVGGVAYGGTTSTYNTINIYGDAQGNGPNLTNAGLYGGYADGAGDVFTGNTLNLKGVKGLTVQSVQHFQNLNFYLPENTQNGDTILTVTGTADIRGSIIGVGIQGGAPTLAVGDTVNLIKAGTLQADASIKTTALQGSTIQYGFNTVQDGNNLVSTVTQRGATQQSKSLVEGTAASAAALNSSADFSTSQGTAAAVRAASGSSAPGGQSFGTMGGGSVRTNTGSHVDVNSFNLVAGVAKGFRQRDGELTLGGFFEGGLGNYSTYNNFTSGTVLGAGKTRSYGLGILAHYDFNNRMYVEASLRGGLADQDYHSGDLVPGTNVSYSTHTNYVGAHLGVGKIWSLTNSLDLDTYVQYLWQRQSGSSVQLSSGESLVFGPVNSQRARLGSRLNEKFTESVSAYIGAAFEHEFDGNASATTNGLPMQSPSLKGSSAMVELGVNMRPLNDKAFVVGLGGQGYFGKKEGVVGTLQIGYKF